MGSFVHFADVVSISCITGIRKGVRSLGMTWIWTVTGRQHNTDTVIPNPLGGLAERNFG